jgi:hypothetical protein
MMMRPHKSKHRVTFVELTDKKGVGVWVNELLAVAKVFGAGYLFKSGLSLFSNLGLYFLRRFRQGSFANRVLRTAGGNYSDEDKHSNNKNSPNRRDSSSERSEPRQPRRHFSSIFDLLFHFCKISFLGRDSFRFGFFLACTSGIFRVVEKLLNRWRSDRPISNAFIAGSLAGLGILLEDESRRREVALYTFLRGSKALWEWKINSNPNFQEKK